MLDDEFVGKRRRSKVEAFYHLVWATKGRQARLTPELERQVYRWIGNTAVEAGCKLIAIGGMPDHLHVVVRAPGKFSPSALARIFKGPASALMNDLRPPFSELFRWQPGYGCFTLSRPHIARIAAYVDGQKEHHASNRLWPDWEEVDEGAPDDEMPQTS